MISDSFLLYWQFHLANYFLAVILYTLIGRALLSFFVSSDSKNYIWRFFRALTDWFLLLIRPITPGFLHSFFVLFYAVFLVLVLRVAVWIIFFNLGWAPTLQNLGL